MKHVLTIEASDAGARIDRLVGARLSLSRATLKDLFERHAVRVNGRWAKKGDTLEPGQVVEVDHEEVPRGVQADASLGLTVLYEDAALVFVDKPAKVPCHPLKPNESGTVANALVARYPELATVGEDPREGGLCHRLDVETSGVLLAARTREAHQAMRAAFGREGEIDKRYLALVSGPLSDEGVIELALAHAGDHVRPATSAEGRPARSEFKVLARRGPFALVEVHLVTGVLHQVRAHLAAIGAPIVGDALYDGPPEEGLSRFFLHAASLEVTHPETNRRLSVRSPLPAELSAVLDRRIPGASTTPALALRPAVDLPPAHLVS